MKLRVLIVEDDRLNAELARDLLEARGHEVELAPDAVTFRALVAGVVGGSARPHIVLMDIRLPDGDGVELLHEARGTLVDYAAGRSNGPFQMLSRLISGSMAKALRPPPAGRPKSIA